MSASDEVSGKWFSEMFPVQCSSEINGITTSDYFPVRTSNVPQTADQAFSLKVVSVLYHAKSKYQDVLVFESQSYGKVLVLDGIIQVTERDEFAYQEMIAHLPLFSHRCPKRVLVIGGGDGGVVREVLKHTSVESVVLCEIDETVIEVCRKFFPVLSASLNHPKVSVNVGDGFEYLNQHVEAFDVIITDSSDPVGPGECLFERPYYELLQRALRSDGILCSQGESSWLHLPLIAKLVEFCSSLFAAVNYAQSSVPTYPSGTIGYLLCSKTPSIDFTSPRCISDAEVSKLKMRYYSYDVHKAAFVHPQFVKNAIGALINRLPKENGLNVKA